MHSFDKDDSGNVFNSCNAKGHQEKQAELADDRLRKGEVRFDTGQQIQSTKRKSVKRKIRSGQKAGIDPFMLRIGTGKEFSE